VLQEREVRRIGEQRARPVDVRVIAATNRRLADEIAGGRFRDDLYYRLRVVEIELAPLRERAADVMPLAELFLEQARTRFRRECVVGFSSEALRAIASHPWPGNVRELENAVERAVALARSEHIELDDLPAELGGGAPALQPKHFGTGATPRTLAEVERTHILDTLASADGTRAEAARRLGISPATLYRKLKEYGVTARA
jgi:two-component system, NtrC family, response regulator HydG